MDGNKLIVISGSYGGNNAEYRTENNTFSKIISYTSNTSNGPDYFIVYTKSGLIYEYGKIDNAKFKAQNSDHIIIWLLNKVTDTEGNYYTVSYIQDRANGEYRPERIDYTGNELSSSILTPYNSIRFNYNSRTITNKSYINGNQSIISHLLYSVDVYYQEELVKKYSLSYSNPVYGKYLLDKIQESNSLQEKFSPVTFEWFTNDN